MIEEKLTPTLNDLTPTLNDFRARLQNVYEDWAAHHEFDRKIADTGKVIGLSKGDFIDGVCDALEQLEYVVVTHVIDNIPRSEHREAMVMAKEFFVELMTKAFPRLGMALQIAYSRGKTEASKYLDCD